MGKNTLVIASAGSGKTTFLIGQALKNEDRVLITTFTEANELQIKKAIISKVGYIPSHITIQTWFSFLLQHGVRPYQGVMYREKITGMLLVSQQSGVKFRLADGTPRYYREDEIRQYYFSKEGKIYSDKVAKFALQCNEKSSGRVISRLSRVFHNILIDEAQDLAGYDLDFLTLLFKSSINVLLVGDPRQTIYLTHHARRYKKYSEGKIKDFILEECKKLDVEIDEESLKSSHRNNADICYLSSCLYPNLPESIPCTCKNGLCDVVKPPEGIFLVKTADIETYLKNFSPVQLRLNKSTKGINKSYRYMNFGISKGQSFDRVLIFPTSEMKEWISDHRKILEPKTRAQFYVAITRAKHSVGIVYDYTDRVNIQGIQKYEPDNNN